MHSPLPHPLTPEDSRRLGETEHRDVFCGAYNGCLDVALRNDWQDWTCAQCPVYRQHLEATRTSRFARR